MPRRASPQPGRAPKKADFDAGKIRLFGGACLSEAKHVKYLAKEDIRPSIPRPPWGIAVFSQIAREKRYTLHTPGCVRYMSFR